MDVKDEIDGDTKWQSHNEDPCPQYEVRYRHPDGSTKCYRPHEEEVGIALLRDILISLFGGIGICGCIFGWN